MDMLLHLPSPSLLCMASACSERSVATHLYGDNLKECVTPKAQRTLMGGRDTWTLFILAEAR